MAYGTVHKTRAKGRVVKVETRTVFGAVPEGGVSPSYLERQNATDRHCNARQVLRPFRFSKDRDVHQALTAFTMSSDLALAKKAGVKLSMHRLRKGFGCRVAKTLGKGAPR
jgi:hypothetical protein